MLKNRTRVEAALGREQGLEKSIRYPGGRSWREWACKVRDNIAPCLSAKKDGITP